MRAASTSGPVIPSQSPSQSNNPKASMDMMPQLPTNPTSVRL